MSDPTRQMNIAIDGYSSCGKSTLARELATALGYTYVDTGAMYRAVTLHFLRNDVKLDDADAVNESLAGIEIEFNLVDDAPRTCLNGEDVEDEIRTLEVTFHVSPVSAISAVRRKLVEQQQRIAESGGVIMEGRDIGTVVLPSAEVKLFVTADTETRVDRRYRELKARGKETTREEVRKSIEERDRIDTTREDSPLRQAEDAILIDNSNMTREEQLQYALDLVRMK